VEGRGRGWRMGGEMAQAMYAHMNKKRKKERKKKFEAFSS
jgi:hypothetical protein